MAKVPKLEKGDVIFFEGLAYKVTETATEPADKDRRQSRLGHFRAEGKRGEKTPSVESDPRHLAWLEPDQAQEELDAEAGQWAGFNNAEQDLGLRKALQGASVANAREAGVAITKLKQGFFYLPGRLIQPPVARPAVNVTKSMRGGKANG